MCNENPITLLDLDFGPINDEGNWNHDSINAFQTVGGFLVIDPSANDNVFKRNVSPSVTNNRVRVRLNFKVEKTDPLIAGNMDVIFQLYNNGKVIHESCVSFSELESGAEYFHFLDRTYKIDGVIDTQLCFRVLVPVGWEHKVFLRDLEIVDFNFCEDKVRTYFSLEEIIENSLIALSGTVDLISWKLDGVETLTPSFFGENLGADKVPASAWKFARADLDGDNRVAEASEPNSFNPFAEEFGLEFDTVGSYYGGKALSVTSGSDYGEGILQLGFEKPCVLNGNLITKKGVFFIDIDYENSLRVEFKVVLNYLSGQTFKWPNQNRHYVLEWDAGNCLKKFYYDFNDENGVTARVNQIHNGFLYGITPTAAKSLAVQCDESFSPAGATGSFSYQLDFGTEIGTAGINYESYNIPDRFIIDWNGQTFDSGFVGLSTYDNQLLNAGVDPADIKTANPSNGNGQLLFNKSSSFPTQATITVLAPLGDTGWLVTGFCPGSITGSLVEVGEAVCGNTPSSWSTVYINTTNLINYIPSNGDIVYSDIALTTPFNGGNETHRMRGTNPPSQDMVDYDFKIGTNGVISSAEECIEALLPSLLEISNISGGAGGIRTQIFEVGSSVSAGNRFTVGVYSVTLEVTAVGGDTPDSIAIKLRDLVNSTTTGEWNQFGSAPNTGTNGYPPTATSSGDSLTVVLNFQNQFGASAFVI